MARDLEQYAQDAVSEKLNGEKGTADDLTNTVEGLESDFDFDSFAPYTSEEDDILSDYEKDHWQEAEDLCSGKEYKATEWADAKRAYVGAVAWCAYSSIFETAKSELTEAIEEFADDARTAMSADGLEDEPEISVSRSCTHGWASHNREDSDGTMYWESGQLDGCNAVCRKVGELWLTCTWTPAKESE